MGVRFLWSVGLAAILLAVSSTRTSADGSAESPLGRKIEGFAAKDFDGREHTLAGFSEKKLVVVAFMGTECPLAKLYGPRLTALAEEFGERGVAFLVVDSNQQDSIAELAHYARRHGIGFPVLRDVGNVIADQFGAIRTPEMFVLDAERVIRYWGRVDDQFGFQAGGIAYQRNEPKRRDLAIALEELLVGKPVSEPTTLAQGCHIGRVKQPVADSEVTFAKDIAPIFNARCVACHREGQIGPFPMNTYEQCVGWAEMIREVVAERRMPPWHADPSVGHFKNDARLSDAEKELIFAWVDNGAPEGNPQDLPPAPTFPEGWQIPDPDQVIYMADQAFEVAASGTIEYQRFVVDPGWTEDKWIQALECVPGNPAVVHHIIIYLIPPGVAPTGQAGRLRSNWLGAFAPGLRQEPLPNGYARFVQAGTKLLFEMHYTANGSKQLDRSYAGFVFADPKTVKKEVAVQNAANFTFKIPPHADNHKVEASYMFRHNSLLLTVSPHMHVRGKDFRYDLIYPDGKTETVLWIPQYDFGWQTTYELPEPKYLPRGTRMHCVAHFDNSEDNLANPDPTAEVGWGEQTWEEMMFGWFEMALADQDLTQPPAAESTRLKEFLATANTTLLTEDLKAQATRALESDKMFEAFALQLFEVVPQLDRLCVTTVDGERLRLAHITQRLGVRSSFESRSTVVRLQGQSLAEYGAGEMTVVNRNLTAARGSIMTGMSRKDIRSSMHVPVRLDGQRATINFWSAEVEAFPGEAVQLLEEVARLMTGSTSVAQK